MKKNAIVRIVIWSIVILVLVGILIAGISLNLFTIRHTAGTTVVENVVVDGEAVSEVPVTVRDICIDWAAGSITIAPGDVDTITFSETPVSNIKDKMVWDWTGEKLTIQCSEDTFSGVGIHVGDYKEKDLTIVVPADWTGNSLEVNAASAKLEVSNLTFREVEIDTASGECRFDSCTVDDLDIDTASGDIRFSGNLRELDCEAASASFVGVLDTVPSRISMDSMSGNLDLTLPENAGFTIDLDAMSSDFSSDFPTVKKDGCHVSGDGACKISVNAMSGDVILRSHKTDCETTDCTVPSKDHQTHSDADHNGQAHS